MEDPFLAIIKETIREDLGCEPTELTFVAAQAAKAAERGSDARSIREGLATAEEIQSKNSAINPGTALRVLDYRPSYER